MLYLDKEEYADIGLQLATILQPAVRIDLDNPRGAIRDFIAQEPVQREIAAQFKNMLRNFTDAAGDLIYKDRLRDMCTSMFSFSRAEVTILN